MNKKVQFIHNGGLPVTQYTFGFMQDGYSQSFAALSAAFGHLTILQGCVVTGINITNGFICYNDEILPVQGGVLGSGGLYIDEVTEQRTYDNLTVHDVYKTKTVKLGTPSTFNYNDLKPYSPFLPGTIQERVVDAAYEAANFDVNGFGINKEKGWRKLSSVYAEAAGAVTVNKKDGDVDFGVVGNFGGSKTHTLTKAQLPNIQLNSGVYQNSNDYVDGPAAANNIGPTVTPNPILTEALGSSQAHNNLQPYFVVLKLIKL